MQILHVTDIHFRSFVFSWIKAQQDHYDAICLTGDFLDETCDTNILDQITWVTNWLLSFEIPVFICSGNHDVIAGSVDWFAGLPYKDGSITKVNDITIGCAPENCEDFYRYRHCDVLLHHYPPYGCDAAIDEHGNNFGSYAFKSDLGLLKKRQYILYSHIHQPNARQVKIQRNKQPDLLICNAGGKHKPDQIQHLVIEI